MLLSVLVAVQPPLSACYFPTSTYGIRKTIRPGEQASWSYYHDTAPCFMHFCTSLIGCLPGVVLMVGNATPQGEFGIPPPRAAPPAASLPNGVPAVNGPAAARGPAGTVREQVQALFDVWSYREWPCPVDGAPTAHHLMPVTEAPLSWAQIELVREDLVTARQARSLHAAALKCS